MFSDFFITTAKEIYFFKFEFKHINFYYCDVDNNLNTSTSANIRGVPTLVKYRKGKEISRKVGASGEAELKAFFKSED